MSWGEEWGFAWGFEPEELDEYAHTHEQLLPKGHAWNYASGSQMDKLRRGMAYEALRVEESAQSLLDESDPRTTIQLLPDWERVAALPEPCGSPPTSYTGRQQALHAKLTARQSITVPFFLELARRLGFPGAELFSMYDPFLASSECTHALYGTEAGWNNTFLLQPGGTGENDGTLRCLVARYAHLPDLFIFEPPEDWQP